jgi:uncharacterized protein (TIGR02246 family)
MQPEAIQHIIEQAANAWIQLDADAFAALFTADGNFIVPGKRWIGQAAIRQAVASFAATSTDVSINISQILVECDAVGGRHGDRAMVEWHWENTDKRTGQQHQADDAIAIDFENGYISRWREYIDTQTWAS